MAGEQAIINLILFYGILFVVLVILMSILWGRNHDQSRDQD
jgi:hypothetical protein